MPISFASYRRVAKHGRAPDRFIYSSIMANRPEPTGTRSWCASSVPRRLTKPKWLGVATPFHPISSIFDKTGLFWGHFCPQFHYHSQPRYASGGFPSIQKMHLVQELPNNRTPCRDADNGAEPLC